MSNVFQTSEAENIDKTLVSHVLDTAVISMTLPHRIVQISWPQAFVTTTRFTLSALNRRRITAMMMPFFERGVRWADVLDDDMACDGLKKERNKQSNVEVVLS